MSINSYIESVTRIDKTKIVEKATWSKVVQGINKPKPNRGKGVVPYQYELEQANQNMFHQRGKKHNKEKKTKCHKTHQQDSQPDYGTHRFADIIPSVREACGGYNTYSNDAIERRFREKQSTFTPTDRNDSNTTYATASSKYTEDSYKTVDSFQSLKITDDDESINEASAGVDSRYKKNALVTGLLQAQNIDYSDIDTSTERSSDIVYNSSLDAENDDENWEKEESDECMRLGRIIRFFQSAEDEDVFVHPLKEQVQKDPQWQKYQLRRKGVEVIQTPRQHYMSVADEDFNFQPKKSA